MAKGRGAKEVLKGFALALPIALLLGGKFGLEARRMRDERRETRRRSRKPDYSIPA